MRIGLIARCDDSGLGNQTYEFYRHMKPAKTMVIDFGGFNKLAQYPERYPDAWRVIKGFPNNDDIDAFLEGLDAVFTCEIPYNYRLFSKAREKGIKTVLQYNWEFLDYLQNEGLPTPDVFAAPSTWHIEDVRHRWLVRTQLLRVPVNTTLLQARPITRARIFKHIAGKPAYKDRNGTETFLDALRLVKSPITAHIQCQDAEAIKSWQDMWAKDPNPNVTFVTYSGFTDANPDCYASLYQETYIDPEAKLVGDPAPDVLVMPRRYGGLCLPMQEALANGMPVIMPDINPNYDLLPKQWLVPCEQDGSFMARTEIPIYNTDVEALAAKIDWFASLEPAEMAEQSNQAQGRADLISWTRQKKHYIALFERITSKTYAAWAEAK